MKLYTEEEIKRVFEFFQHSYSDITVYLQELKPIQLPSDEEIDNQADFSFPYAEKIGGETYSAFLGMKVGAKWMKEQILNQNK